MMATVSICERSCTQRKPAWRSSTVTSASELVALHVHAAMPHPSVRPSRRIEPTAGGRFENSIGFIDRAGLTPGGTYDYRIRGRVPRADRDEARLDFHTVPRGYALPARFALGAVTLHVTPAPVVEADSEDRGGLIALRAVDRWADEALTRGGPDRDAPGLVGALTDALLGVPLRGAG